MRRSGWLFSVAVVVAALAVGLGAERASGEEVYYGIEIGGTLCGYSVIETSPLVVEGKSLVLMRQRVFAMLSALGSRFNTEVRLTYHIDPATGGFVYHDSDVRQGQVRLDSKIVISEGRARFSSSMSAEEKVVDLPVGVILPNTFLFPWLKADFVDGGLAEKSYEIFEVREAAVQRTTYRKVGVEKVELAVGAFDAVVLESMNHATGQKAKHWIRVSDGWLLRSETAGGRAGFLADASVMKRIELANLDETIVRKTNVRIGDVAAISYMKVKAVIEPTGLWITPESLNVPGQKFTGTVVENRVEGVFEVSHPRYSGEGAPPFPTPTAFGEDSALAPWLEPSDFIESGDPVLVAKAKALTAGASDSWDAARRLSGWVAENIEYAIPGGGTARKTYDLRAGECGSHSILVATFCRAVGIPARVVWGCMYIPNFGGAFGQHAWNEIYMGEAGWVPVDATAFETDFADSGHIRIGVLDSASIFLNAISMEVLDHRLGDGKDAEAGEDQAAKYGEYVGEYTLAARGVTMKVLVSAGGLAVDIPNKVVLALKDPDEEGRWYAKLSNRVFCTFERGESGAVARLLIHELVRFSKQSSPETIDEAVPEEYRRYLGKYLLAPRNAEFEVLWKDGHLAINDPLAKKVIGLRPPDDKGRFVDEFGKNTTTFEADEEGKIVRLVIDAVSRLNRN